MTTDRTPAGVPGVDHEITEVDGVVTAGSDSFLADRGHRNPAEHRAKVLLADDFRRLMQAQGLTQAEAAMQAGLAQTDISRIVRGLVRGYSVWKLAKALNDLGAATEIVVRLPEGETHAIAVG
ncbi:XRE family transcriptional regulator [Rhodocista pekingensis]|uniref:XRE family transcriptional regulator n=1 Tax=Rhodocista pekingensis TaxID=201185 RepID=A0ABW2KZE3_9PROT